jgi:hypothetical protein
MRNIRDLQKRYVRHDYGTAIIMTISDSNIHLSIMQHVEEEVLPWRD